MCSTPTGLGPPPTPTPWRTSCGPPSRPIDYCLTHAGTCVEAAARYQTGYLVHQNIQRWQLETGEVDSTLLAGHGVGYEDMAQWGPEYKLLLADHLIRHAVALTTIINANYINAIYHGPSLVWPGP